MTASKYNNKRTEYKGETYASKAEAEFAMFLDLMRNAENEADRVAEVRTQVSYVLTINPDTRKPLFYVADFVVNYADGTTKVYDVKGMRGGVPYQLFKLKKALMLEKYNIYVIEVRKKKKAGKSVWSFSRPKES